MAHKEICLAGGCFWGTEAYLKLLPGVLDTSVGYANASIENPTYEDVCSGITNAAEAVMVEFDDEIISLDMLLEAYFRTIDPTSLNRQGNDRGTQYRTGVYWIDGEDADAVVDFIAGKQSSYDKPIVVEAAPLENFYLAEDYHQDYLDKNIFGYCHVNLADARKFVEQNFSDASSCR